MGLNVLVSTSVLSCDFGKLAEALKLCETSGADRVHVDVMDGHFVPNISIGPVIVSAVRRYTRLPIAAHLMIENPWNYIESFALAGADIIALHAECYGERRSSCRACAEYPKEIDALDSVAAQRDILLIQKLGKEPCMVINPGTPLSVLDPVLPSLNSVLLMSVNPGFSGQKFMPSALPRISSLRSRFSGDIVVDGGVNEATAPDVVRAGANVLVTASYFFGSPDPAATVRSLKALG